MLRSPVAAARAAVATGAWVESKHDTYLIHTWKCGSSSFIFTHPPEDEKKKKEKSIPGTWCGTCKHPTDYKSEVRKSVLRVKTPCEQGLPHCTYVLQAEQRLPHATEEMTKRSFPIERGPTAKHHQHPAWNAQCTQWFRAEDPLLCATPEVMLRFSLGDAGEAR